MSHKKTGGLTLAGCMLEDFYFAGGIINLLPAVRFAVVLGWLLRFYASAVGYRRIRC